MARLNCCLPYAAVAAALSAVTAPAVVAADERHALPDWGLSFPLPAGYVEVPATRPAGTPGTTAAVIHRRQENSACPPRFNVICRRLPDALPGDSVPTTAEADLRQGIAEGGGKVLGLTRFKVGDREAVAVAFTARDVTSGIATRGRTVVMARHHVLYHFIFVAPEQRFAAESPAYEKVVRGIHWLGQGPPPAVRWEPAPVTLGPKRSQPSEARVERHGVALTVPTGYRDEQIRTDDQPDGAVTSAVYRKTRTAEDTTAVARIHLFCDAAEGKKIEDELPPDIEAKWIAAVRRNPENRDVRISRTTAGGRKAVVLEYLKLPPSSEGVLRERLTIFAHRRTLYVLSVNAREDTFAAEEPAFDAVLKSVRWLPEGGGAK